MVFLDTVHILFFLAISNSIELPLPRVKRHPEVTSDQTMVSSLDEFIKANINFYE